MNTVERLEATIARLHKQANELRDALRFWIPDELPADDPDYERWERHRELAWIPRDEECTSSSASGVQEDKC